MRLFHKINTRQSPSSDCYSVTATTERSSSKQIIPTLRMQFVELRVSFHMMTSLRKIPFCCFFLEDTVLNHPHHFSSTSADMLPNTFLGGQHISALSRDHLFISYPILFFFKGDELKRIYLFLAALGLHCRAWVLPGCSRHGLLSVGSAQASHCSGSPGCGARAPGRAGSAALPHGLSCFVAVESLRTRDRTWRDPCTGS